MQNLVEGLFLKDFVWTSEMVLAVHEALELVILGIHDHLLDVVGQTICLERCHLLVIVRIGSLSEPSSSNTTGILQDAAPDFLLAVISCLIVQFLLDQIFKVDVVVSEYTFVDLSQFRILQKLAHLSHLGIQVLVLGHKTLD